MTKRLSAEPVLLNPAKPSAPSSPPMSLPHWPTCPSSASLSPLLVWSPHTPPSPRPPISPTLPQAAMGPSRQVPLLSHVAQVGTTPPRPLGLRHPAATPPRTLLMAKGDQHQISWI